MEDHITPHQQQQARLILILEIIIQHHPTVAHILDTHILVRPTPTVDHTAAHTADHMVGHTETAHTQQTPQAPTLIQVNRD